MAFPGDDEGRDGPRPLESGQHSQWGQRWELPAGQPADPLDSQHTPPRPTRKPTNPARPNGGSGKTGGGPTNGGGGGPGNAGGGPSRIGGGSAGPGSGPSGLGGGPTGPGSGPGGPGGGPGGPKGPRPGGPGGPGGPGDAEDAEARREARRQRIADTKKAVRSAAGGVGRASKKTAGVTGRAGRATGTRIRRLTSAQGAGESGLARLIELGAVNAAADTAFAVSLAGSVFFAVPSSEARGRIALFLLLTMAPFALMAPLIGPLLDRFRHGRRWAIGATLGVRAFLVWSLAATISGGGSTWLYPAALGCLVASKAYGVTRASAVPRLLPKEITLVTANSRVSLAGVAGASVSAGISGGFAAIGPEWSLRWAAVLYAVGLVLAIRLPAKVDSPAGEEVLGAAGKTERRRSVTAAVARGIRCNLGLRFLSGFLTMFLAFLLRDHPTGGISGTVLAGIVIGAAGLGNSGGTALGSLLKARKPEMIVLAVLVADVTLAVVAAVFYGVVALVALGLVAGLCSSLGKLSLDAMIQRDVPENVRTSVFARSETVLQLAWVIGGGCGILMPLVPRLGFGFLAAVLVLLLIVVLRPRPTYAARPTRDADPSSASHDGHPGQHPDPAQPDQRQGTRAPAPVRRTPDRPPGRPHR